MCTGGVQVPCTGDMQRQHTGTGFVCIRVHCWGAVLCVRMYRGCAQHSSVTKAVRKGGRDAGSEKGGRGEEVRRMISLYLGRWKIAPVGGVVV